MPICSRIKYENNGGSEIIRLANHGLPYNLVTIYAAKMVLESTMLWYDFMSISFNCIALNLFGVEV